MANAKKFFPQVKEFFFDDDTFTDDLPRAEEIARRLGKLGMTWSCNAKANVPRKTLEILRENGLRLRLVGYESGNQQILNNIKKGIRLDIAREFTKNAKELGIVIHGTFILGLPGETPATINETIRFACEINPETLQVSLAAPYPGTELYRQAQEQGWLQIQTGELVDTHGVQVAALNFPNLESSEIFESVDEVYRKFSVSCTTAKRRPRLRGLRARAPRVADTQFERPSASPGLPKYRRAGDFFLAGRPPP